MNPSGDINIDKTLKQVSSDWLVQTIVGGLLACAQRLKTSPCSEEQSRGNQAYGTHMDRHTLLRDTISLVPIMRSFGRIPSVTSTAWVLCVSTLEIIWSYFTTEKVCVIHSYKVNESSYFLFLLMSFKHVVKSPFNIVCWISILM